MAMRGAIEAGKALVRVFLDRGTFDKQLKSWKSKLDSFATGLRVIADSFAIGKQILAPIQKLVSEFLVSGDRLAKLSDITGISVESLSLLGTVAARSGADVELIARSVGFMNKTLFGAVKPSAQASAALNQLHLKLSDLKKLSPEERFATIAGALARIPDDGKRSALAMALFGKSAQELLPYINEGAEGLKEQLERAKALGLELSERETAPVEEFNDNLDDVKDQLRAVGAQIAAAVLPVLTELLKIIQPILVGVINWAKQNHGLIRVLAGVVLGAVAMGSALGGIAAAIAAIMLIGPGLLLTMKLLFLAFGGIVSVLISPAGVLGALLFFSGALGGVLASVKEVLGGIWDAIMAGNWQLAGQIAMLGLALGFETGVNMLRQIWDDFATWIVGRFDFAATAVGATWRALVAELLAAASHIPGMEELGVVAEGLRREVAGAAGGFGEREKQRSAAADERTAEAEKKLNKLRAALAGLQGTARQERAALDEKLSIDASQKQEPFAGGGFGEGAGFGAIEGAAAAILASEFAAAAPAFIEEPDAAEATADHTETIAKIAQHFDQMFGSGEMGFALQ